MSSQRENTTPQPTPGHSCNYSQVADDALAEEARLEAERRQKEEEEAQRKKAAEEEAERQRQRASQERAQARQDEAAQRLSSTVYNINTAQRVPGTSVVVTVTRRPPCTRCIASLMAGQCEPGQGKTRACVPCHNKKKTCSWTQEEVAAGDKNEEADEGAEGDNEEEEEVRGEKEGGEEQEGGRGQVMEE
ncbi:hypothetical protein M404DRAFT_23509 [Pisolithus tinctorius Marx 270]|uniref:Uncharacterized protein n=1 Tax=Pisolithus tinctorius Marx 270 TaxID=870435 RepID=A0A0C3PGW6_PISTI|nr:hypothetical protein M404DRAFT_23509 [Pisolithus tinctorius Marx 270]